MHAHVMHIFALAFIEMDEVFVNFGLFLKVFPTGTEDKKLIYEDSIWKIWLRELHFTDCCRLSFLIKILFIQAKLSLELKR